MTRSTLTLRSLTHYWRWHLGLFLGVLLVTGGSVAPRWRATAAG